MVSHFTQLTEPTPVRVPTQSGSQGVRQLSDILLELQMISPADLVRGQALQTRTHARLTDILLAHRMIGIDDLLTAYAVKYVAQVINITENPPNLDLVDALGAGFCLRHGILAWRDIGGVPVVLTSRPEDFENCALSSLHISANALWA